MKILQELTEFNNKKLCGLNTKWLAQNYIFFDEIDSTQKEIWRRINENKIISGTLIRANLQTAGIGTHGRIWYSTKENIAFSFYLELGCDVKKIENLTTHIAEIIVGIINDKYKIKLDIKIPNDLYANGKKIGGILTEAKTTGNKVKYIVVGIGLNNSENVFDKKIVDIATSFEKEFGITINNDEFIANFCNFFEKEVLFNSIL